MARRLRIQFDGAIYHVINRGNYRRDVFETADKAAAFERTLFETCDRLHWRLHAYVLMRNHYHLAVETPKADLVEGMHWLQGTFATRFNRFRQERGHLFQGRYQSLLVEPGAILNRVIDYIHLNPVRAGIIPPEHIVDFRWGSLRRFVRGERPACLSPSAWLSSAGLSDDPNGWEAYEAHLVELANARDQQKKLGFADMTKGWAFGTQGWRQALARDHSRHALDPGIATQDLIELKNARWELALNDLLQAAGKDIGQAPGERKSAAWKIEIAAALRKSTSAPNRWIANKLYMGTPGSVSQYLSKFKQGH